MLLICIWSVCPQVTNDWKAHYDKQTCCGHFRTLIFEKGIKQTWLRKRCQAAMVESEGVPLNILSRLSKEIWLRKNRMLNVCSDSWFYVFWLCNYIMFSRQHLKRKTIQQHSLSHQLSSNVNPPSQISESYKGSSHITERQRKWLNLFSWKL